MNSCPYFVEKEVRKAETSFILHCERIENLAQRKENRKIETLYLLQERRIENLGQQ